MNARSSFTGPYGLGTQTVHVWLGPEDAKHRDHAAVVAKATSSFEIKPRPLDVIGFYCFHDTSVAVARGGEILGVLEFERLHEIRHFAMGGLGDAVHWALEPALVALLNATGMRRDHVFDVGVIGKTYYPAEDESLRKQLMWFTHARKWEFLDHHLAHAYHAFYESDYERALVFTYDGEGNDGTFVVYRAERGVTDRGRAVHGDQGGGDHAKITQIANLPLHMGHYVQFGFVMEEVAGSRFFSMSFEEKLTLAGKVMAYEALGKVRPEWEAEVASFYRGGYPGIAELMPALGLRAEPFITTEEARDLAATTQRVFTMMLEEVVNSTLRSQAAFGAHGLVLVGGCALNVKANERMRQLMGGAVFVPSAPNDPGQSVGLVWSVQPPPRGGVYLGHVGLPLWDAADLMHHVAERGGQAVTPEAIASTLLAAHIIGVVRGRAEYGPRALGHRSLLAYPGSLDIKDKLNALKHRQQYRPVAPIVAAEYVHQLIGQDSGLVSSPYMSFAPALTPDALAALPAIAHLDGTARVQTLEEAQDPWVYAVLMALRRRGFYPVIANTSFNRLGKPILNSIKDALHILDTAPELSYVVVEDYIFSNPHLQLQ